MEVEKLLTTKDLEESFGKDAQGIRRLARLGYIPAIKTGSQWYFSPSAIQQWINGQLTGNTPAQPPAQGAQAA